jgi:cob(I)alamin adenosyltransferase
MKVVGDLAHKGLIHIYYGDGKGKTTAALGLALRAAGCGQRVVIVQFLKDWKCGELSSLALLPNIAVLRGKADGGVFIHEMTEQQKAETKNIHDDNLKKALEMQSSGQCDLLILDEAIDAYTLDVLDAGLFEGLLDSKPDPLELVITGHDPPPRLLDRADYATMMVKQKHPYDTGVAARRGVEF